MATIIGVIRMTAPPVETLAERMLDLAAVVLHPAHQVICMDNQGCTDQHLDRIKLAIALHRKPAGFKIRAIVEDWDHTRLIREMY